VWRCYRNRLPLSLPFTAYSYTLSLYSHLAPVTTSTTGVTHALVGSSKLQYLGDRAEITSLIISQTFDDAHVDYVKRVGSNNCRVDVSVVDEVTNDLNTRTDTDIDTVIYL